MMLCCEYSWKCAVNNTHDCSAPQITAGETLCEGGSGTTFSNRKQWCWVVWVGWVKEGVMGYSTAIFWLQHQSSHNRCWPVTAIRAVAGCSRDGVTCHNKRLRTADWSPCDTGSKWSPLISATLWLPPATFHLTPSPYCTWRYSVHSFLRIPLRTCTKPKTCPSSSPCHCNFLSTWWAVGVENKNCVQCCGWTVPDGV